jgi:excisionase family DNA binding protein
VTNKPENWPKAARQASVVGRLNTIAEVAERLNVCERTVRRWIAAGLLPVHRFGRTLRISEVDLAAFLALRREA